MPLAERRARYRDMIAQLRSNNVSVWRDTFLRDLAQAQEGRPATAPPSAKASAARAKAPRKRVAA
jgi:trehalose 6-phosphate synthase